MVVAVLPLEAKSNSISHPISEAKQGEGRVTLCGVSWLSYQQILQAVPERRSVRITYDRGTLEITMPSVIHEFSLRLIERFIIILVVEMGMKVKTMGSITMSHEGLKRGAEPDCAYYIQNQSKVVGKTVDFTQDPPPNLVVEVDITHTDIDKNSLYASMGIPEFWRYNGKELCIYQLQEEKYVECDRSPTFIWVQKEDLHNFLAEAQEDEVAAEIKFRAFVKGKLQD
jgi:Uma2 family endonuclease